MNSTARVQPEERRADPAHAELVNRIASEIRARAEAGEPLHIYKGGVHHFVPLPRDRRFQGRRVDISALNRVIEIDPVGRTCIAEPGITFAELVKATLQHGLLPTVVPELEGITLGGAVAGCSVESMSYRYGGFHDSCLEYEIVSTSGEIVHCSPQKEPLLFDMIHGSYGTLGVLTSLTFKLIPAERFVHLVYRTFSTAAEYETEMRARVAAADFDFIDGIIHSRTEYVLCLGRFAKSAPYTSNYRWLHIFYKSTRTRSEDYLATEDYLFRYDTECHWLTKTVPPLEWKAVRFAIGKFCLGSTKLIRWSALLEPILKLKKRPDVVVDVFIPIKRLTDFFDWYHATMQFYPLWIVPYRIAQPYPWISAEHAAQFSDDLFVDCAVYGKRNSDPQIDYSQLIEDKTYELGGLKTLISRNHHSREQFWKIYHQQNYQTAKRRLDPKGAFPALYEKFHQEVRQG